MLDSFRRTISFFVPTSLAGRSAATAAGLVVTLVSIAVAYVHLSDSWSPFSKPDRLATILGLGASIPALVYIGVRIWGREDESLYPDIDEAWRDGIEALENVGLAPSAGSAPFFLVLGGGEVEDAFVQSMRAAGESFRVSGAPTSRGESPSLRWYATDSGIYLFCLRVGALGRLVDAWSHPVHDLTREWGRTFEPGEINSASRSASARHRIMVSVSASDIHRERVEESAINAPSTTPEPLAGNLPTNIDYVNEALRLGYLCRLIKRARRPRCGINGAVAIIPYYFVDANKNEIGSIVSSIQKDLRTIHSTLRLRFPISGLVVGMEKAVGFSEFAKLIGPPLIYSRLGEGFDVFHRTTADRVQQACDHICDHFEEFVYALYARASSISRPAENRKLYRLLCQVRRQIKPQLCQLLTAAFARSDRRDLASAFENGDEPPAYFSGCYLASTGSRPDDQAFVKGVLFDKMVKQQGKVEWTYPAYRSHFRFRLAVIIGWVFVVALMIVALILTISSG